MTQLFLAISIVASFAAGLGLATQSRDSNARTRDIYVSAVDSKGAPVAGLGIADVVIREDGALREVLKVGPATAPLQIMMLIDDSQAAEPAIQPMREGLSKFVEKLNGKADIGLVTVGERPTSIVEHTTDVTALKKGITRVFSRQGSGSYLLEGILEVSKGLQKREVERAHIIAISMEAVEFSTLQAQTVLSQLTASGAAFHVLAIGQPLTSLDDESRNRNIVIADGTAQTGGRRDQLLAEMGIPERLLKVADDLLNQYVVTYGRPDALIPPTKVQVTSAKAGVTLRAKTRLTSSGK